MVIAINIGTPLLPRNDITSLLSVSDQLVRMLTNNNVSQSLKELGPDDVLITPDLGTVGTANFDRLTFNAQGALSLLKGREHVQPLGIEYPMRLLALGTLAIAAAIVRNERFQIAFDAVSLVYQLSWIQRSHDKVG